MEPQPHDETSPAPFSQVRRADRVCDLFEAAWKAGPRPRIDAFLAEVPPGEWPELLRELLLLDLDYRRTLGEQPTLEQYRVQYPALEFDRFAPLFAEPAQPEASGHAEETRPFTPSDMPDGQLPRIHYLGDYELLAVIARGGMGVVYKARQLSLNRVVAVKMILAGLLATKADHDRFHAEAEAAALLDHPNIVPVFEVGEHEGQHYFSMGYVEGSSLSARLDEGPLAPKEAAELVATVAEAVEYAHRLGVIHRDLKPSNILIDSTGRPRVTDFGLAKRLDSGSELTATGQVLGTPSYMPPEQAAGHIHAVGPAADVYALGAVLYTALTGRPPFQAATPLETLKQVIERDPVPLRQLNAGVPLDLETIVLKCLEKAVPRRYATAQALAEDLRRYLEGRPIVARPAGRWERAWRWCRREPVVASLSATAALLVVLVAVASTAGYVSTSRALRQVVAAQRARVLAQVDALREAEISRVPDLIEGLKPFRVEIVPQLRESLRQPELGEKERLRLSLAMVAEDKGQVAYLYDRLLSAEPAELLVIRESLLPYRETLVAQLWLTADDPAAATDRRFRAFCALAAFDPKSSRWTMAGKPAAEVLVAEDPLVAAAWVEVLRPARSWLLAGLQAIFRDQSCSDSQRTLATSILADYAADRPDMLADLLMDADEKQFAVIYKKLKERGEDGLPYLQDEVAKPMPDAAEDLKEALAKRQSNAAVALLKMNQTSDVWPLLKHSPDPRVRSYLIHRLAPLGADCMVLVRRLNEEPDVSIRRALILCLGEFETTQFPAAERKLLIARLLDLYRNDPDPGLHGAAEWLLRQKGWDQRSKLAEIDAQLQVGEKQLQQARNGADQRQWYVNTEGQTFVILRADKPFRMGSPEGEPDRSDNEGQHQQSIGRIFAIASKVVTTAQFRRFQDANPDVLNPDLSTLKLTDDSPQVEVDWYDAAHYCNWLSQIVGIPKEQWCYEPSADGKYAQGMKPAADFLQRVGYRLPTEDEWEYACRSGSRTSRYYGLSVNLLPKYAWFIGNSDYRQGIWPVAMKKPNDFGLFDMLGNVWQWGETRTDTWGRERRIARGGSSSAEAYALRCAYYNFQPELETRGSNVGFRVARTCR